MNHERTGVLGVACGIVPALQAAKSDVSGMLNGAGGRNSRGRGSMAMHKGIASRVCTV